MSVSEGVRKDGNSYVPVPNQMATQSRFQEKKIKDRIYEQGLKICVNKNPE